MRCIHVGRVVSLLLPALALSLSPSSSPAATPRRVEARPVTKVVAPTVRAARRAPRPKLTRVQLETDGREVVLEAQAVTGAPIVSSDDGAPTGEVASTASLSGDDEATSESPESSDTEVPLPLDEGRWDPVCTPPCDHRLPRAATYRITGAGITTSSTFQLPRDRPQVTLDVKPGTARWYWTGIIVAALGGSFLIGGLGPPLLLGGSFSTTEKVLGGTGVVMVGVGLPLWLLNRTKVSIF